MAEADLSLIENTVDVYGVDDFLPHMPEVRGRLALGHRLARRLTCPRGRVPWLPNDGTDLRLYLLAKKTPGEIAQAAKLECLKDEQVERVTASVEVLGSGTQMILTLIVEDAAGPFKLTLTIDVAAETLIALEAA